MLTVVLWLNRDAGAKNKLLFHTCYNILYWAWPLLPLTLFRANKVWPSVAAVGGRRVGEGKRMGSMWRVVYSVGAGHRVRESTVKGRGKELTARSLIKVERRWFRHIRHEWQFVLYCCIPQNKFLWVIWLLRCDAVTSGICYSRSVYSSTLKMLAARAFEMSAFIYHITRRHIPEDTILHDHCFENPTFHHCYEILSSHLYRDAMLVFSHVSSSELPIILNTDRHIRWTK